MPMVVRPGMCCAGLKEQVCRTHLVRDVYAAHGVAAIVVLWQDFVKKSQQGFARTQLPLNRLRCVARPDTLQGNQVRGAKMIADER